MQKKNWTRRLALESLEERAVPATFDISNTGVNLTLTQKTGTLGTTLIITDNPTAGTITFEDQVGPVTYPVGTSSNITINYLANDTATTYNYNLASMRSGSVVLNPLNSTTRTLNIDAAAGIGTNLTVQGGTAALTVAETTALNVGGNAAFNGGNANDTLSLGVANSVIGGSLTINKFNTVTANTTGDVIGTNLSFNDSGEFTPNTLTLTGARVGGTVNYIGGSNTDAITLTDTIVGQSLTVNFGTQTAGTSSLGIMGTSSVGGSLGVTGGNLGTQTVTLAATATLNGNATFNLGNATNTVTFNGTFTGSSFTYGSSITGGGTDTVTYNLAAGSGRARFTAYLGAMADTVNFGTGATNPSYAYIDFGAGVDVLTGTVNFPFTFLNLP